MQGCASAAASSFSSSAISKFAFRMHVKKNTHVVGDFNILKKAQPVLVLLLAQTHNNTALNALQVIIQKRSMFMHTTEQDDQ